MTRPNSSKTQDTITLAVRAAALEFHSDHPEAGREEILAHLQEAGFGSSSYPVMSWIKEAASEAAQEVAAAQPGDGNGAQTPRPPKGTAKPDWKSLPNG